MASGGAAEGEHAVYAFHAQTLRLAGCSIPPSATSDLRVGGCALPSGPRVVLGAAFRPTIGAAVSRGLVGKAKIALTSRSSLHVEGDVILHELNLDGALTIIAEPGSSIVIKQLRVSNAGSVLRELSEAELAPASSVSEVSKLRGYVYDDVEVHELRALGGSGEVVVQGEPVSSVNDGLEWRVRKGPVAVQ